MKTDNELNVTFLTSEQVRGLLGVSNRTLQNYRSEGKLRYIAFSKKTIRYLWIDVRNFIQNSSSTSYHKDSCKKYFSEY